MTRLETGEYQMLFSCLSCVRLFCDPVDCSLPGSTVHGISQARILEWIAISLSRGSSQPRDLRLLHCERILYHWATWEASIQREIVKHHDPLTLVPLKHATLRPISSSFSDCDSPQLNNHHQMVNTEIRLIIFFATKDREALHSQQKEDGSWLWLRSWNPYCQIQTKIEETRENH